MSIVKGIASVPRLIRVPCGPLLAALFVWIFSGAATAHPVAQGGMVVMISPNQLTTRITVSPEEVLVASAYGRNSARAKSPSEAAKEYGGYLLEHVQVLADGQPLHGQLTREDSSQTEQGALRFVYQFVYPLANPASKFRFEENVLNEFEFAPGNRWEASYVVQITEEGQSAHESLLLTSRQPLVFLRETPSSQTGAAPHLDRARVLRDYFRHGLLHILTGYDHLLFVTALVLSVRSLWELVKVVTAFTLAHSITLALSAFDLFRLPSSVVEPMIAVSIIFVALQNIFWPERTRGGARLAVAFFFGLFHGLGFAGGLLNAMQGMSSNGLVLAILGFSAGVEAGHQVVVLPTFCALKFARGWQHSGTDREARALLLSRWGSGAISLAGMVYLGAALRWW
jgi:hydrogenase/urease accessory protein HupE